MKIDTGAGERETYIRAEAFDTEKVRADLARDGFSIVRGLVPTERIASIRAFWIEKFSSAPEGRVTWSPYLGQANHIGFSADSFQNLFRSCDFFWNPPIHEETRQVGIEMNALRNLLLDKDPAYGLRFTDNRYGIFMTASYYPAHTGYMQMHRDTVVAQESLIHCLAPMTHKGIDYAEGGMVLVDRHGNQLDVEGMLVPGDAVFYDGALEHAVAPIVPLPGKDIGRLQILPLPTWFTDIKQNPRALNVVPVSVYARAKWVCFKNALRIRLGFRPSLR